MGERRGRRSGFRLSRGSRPRDSFAREKEGMDSTSGINKERRVDLDHGNLERTSPSIHALLQHSPPLFSPGLDEDSSALSSEWEWEEEREEEERCSSPQVALSTESCLQLRAPWKLPVPNRSMRAHDFTLTSFISRKKGSSSAQIHNTFSLGEKIQLKSKLSNFIPLDSQVWPS